MKPFDFYIKIKKVRKVSIDTNLAKSLIKDMKERINSANKLPIEFSKIIFENYYDALRAFCDAILAKTGFKSYSHEASIINLEKYNFTFIEILELDNFRQLRNYSKYYGKGITGEQANKIKKYYIKIKQKIELIIRRLEINNYS